MKTVKQKVKELYNAGMPTRKIRKVLGLEFNEYQKLYRELRNNNEITPRKFGRPPRKRKPVKNFSYIRSGGTYQIHKNGRYYGHVRTYKQAERLVELLRENDWNIDLFNNLKKQVIEVEGVKWIC